MKVKYIGEEGRPGSGSTSAFGREFRIGEAVEVSDDIAERCRRNRYFEVIEDDAPASNPDLPQNEDGLQTLDRDELIRIAEDSGVEIDKRWKADRIRAAIEGRT